MLRDIVRRDGRRVYDVSPRRGQGPDSIEKNLLEFRLGKQLEFPYLILVQVNTINL